MIKNNLYRIYNYGTRLALYKYSLRTDRILMILQGGGTEFYESAKTICKNNNTDFYTDMYVPDGNGIHFSWI